MPLIDVPTIHAVTDPQILADPGFMSQAEAVFRALGTTGAVHLRAPEIGASRLYSMAMYLRRLERVTGCRLVINDRADVARAAGAWGVQLGQRSMAPGDARRVVPDAAMGVSVHSLAEASNAMEAGVDWIVAGHVFETPSHNGVPPRGVEFIRSLRHFRVPVIAIGGVLPSHVPALREAGAHGIAVIRGIWGSSDPGAAARAYLQVS
jgi:thiamine-phosphate diphosphorylase